MIKRFFIACLGCILIATSINVVSAKSAEINESISNTESITEDNEEYRLPEDQITFNYKFNKDNTITITGFSDKTKQILYSDDSTNCYIDTLVIPAKLLIGDRIYQVTTIGWSAFPYMKVNHVILEEGITHIMGYFVTANVKSITFPATLKAIDTQAFGTFSTEKIILSDDSQYFCLNENILFSKDGTTLVWAPFVMGTYRIPANVTKIAGGAFMSNTNLKKIVFHNKVSFIGDYAFYGCENLNAIFPKKLDNIGKYAFMHTSLNNLKVFPLVKVIGAYAFYQTKITQIVLPEGTEEVADAAFATSSHVIRLYIPASLKIIGANAFRFDEQVEAYEYDSKLKSKDISINKNNKYFSIKNGCLLNKTGTKLIQVLSAETNLIVPKSVITIREGAMSNNHAVIKVVLQDNCKIIPQNCFEDCTKLKTIIIPQSVKEIKNGALETIPGEAVRTVIFKGKTPPMIYRNLPQGYDSLDEVNWEYEADSMQLLCIKVPKGCKNKYEVSFSKSDFIYLKLVEV